jgi:ribosomal protein S18 acetylase RimI-like enzyme
MDRVYRWARAQGAVEVELTVYEFNEPAIAFYTSLGYETSSRRMSKRLE